MEEHSATFGIIVETRCNSAEQRWISNAYRSRGWSTAWSAPIIMDGRQGRSGGALVIANADWIQAESAMEVELRASAANYVVSTWQSITARQDAILVAYYGHPTESRQTERDIATLCNALAAFDDYLIFLAGDFNVHVREQHYVPYSFVDVHEALALQSNQRLLNTSYTPNGEARPDRVYMPTRQWGSLQDASVHHDSLLATHTPLVVTLTREKYRALCQSPGKAAFVKPRDGPLPDGVGCFADWSGGWSAWLAGGDKICKPRSHGVPTLEEEITWTRSTTSRWIRRLRNLAARVVALHRMRDKGGDMAQALWKRIAAQAKPFLEKYGAPQTWGCSNTAEEATEEVLQALQNHMQKVIREQLKHDGRDRGHKYRFALNENGGINRKVSRMVREGTAYPLLSVKDGDNVLTNADDIFAALREAWKPYHETPEPDPGPRLDPWLDLLPEHDFDIGANSPDYMAEAVRSMGSNTSTGADAWPIRELKLLPRRAWEQFAHVMDEVEYTGEWPGNHRWVWLSTLAKSPLACLPRKVRPIAILPSTYRVWAKARFQQPPKLVLEGALNSTFPPSQKSHDTFPTPQ